MGYNRSSLRIGIDATPMLVAQRTGIERYATALIRELAILYPTLDGIQLFVYLHAGNPYTSALHLDEAQNILQTAAVPYRIYAPRRGYGGTLSLYTLVDRLDLLHMLSRTRPWVQICPYLLTIYDIKSVGLSEEGRRIEQAALSARQTRVIQEAAGLITISASTARDLKGTFGDKLAMPIRTIHLGVDAAYFCGPEHAQAVRQKYGLERYIFFVGTLQYRKNLPRLIEAFARAKRAHHIPHKLVLAGRDGWGAELLYAAVQEQELEEEVIFPGYIPESDLPGLYAGADVFVYPSLHEGFGIPLLEAMAAETVVYTSNLFSIPEVAGDAAVYVDPHNVDDMAVGLWRALCDNALRAELVEKGKTRVASFSWQRMALETLDFYRELGK
jgi:glycosyltransferase involved in cell wall biosynthesis